MVEIKEGPDLDAVDKYEELMVYIQKHSCPLLDPTWGPRVEFLIGSIMMGKPEVPKKRSRAQEPFL